MEGLMAAPVSGVDAKYLSCLLLNLAFILKERITHKSIIIYFNDSAVESVQDFFDQVGHETMHASSGNKHFSLNLVILRLTMKRADKNWAKF